MSYIAVVGLGSIGHRHLRNCRRLFPQHQLIAVSSSGRTPKEAIEADIVLADLARLQEYDLSLVIIASPAIFHHLHLAQLPTDLSCPLLIEKPIADSAEHVREIEHFSHQYAGKIAVGYCLRFLPAAKTLKSLIACQQYGAIKRVTVKAHSYLPQWRPDKDYRDSVSAQKRLGGGALLELSHELDYLAWFFGSLSIKSAEVHQSNLLEIDVEDSAHVQLSGEQIEIIELSLSFVSQESQRYCIVECEQADIYWDLLNNTVTIKTNNATEVIYDGVNYDRNNMYLDMTNCLYQQNEISENEKLASVTSAASTVALIEKIKQLGKLD